ncbi:MAG: alpha/beta hydrolase [Candidatus Heimdallarchaeota archaeon]|nr:alpha/beta hydrolase [Candidatus Heimdallarchaeota archaeon]
MLEEKRISVTHGRMAYYINSVDAPAVLFIHDVSGNRDWVKQVDIPQFRWIIPDLLGFGTSHRSEKFDAHSMKQYAEDLLTLLKHENISSISVIGQGLGGVIGIYLLEMLDKEDIKLDHFFTILGTYHINDLDPFYKMSYEEYKEDFDFDIERYTRLNTPMSRLIANHLRKQYPFSIWAVHKKLSEVLMEEFPQVLQSVQIPIHYIIGEEVRGERESEKLMKGGIHDVTVIPESKINVHLENPAEFFDYLARFIY